MNNNLNGFQKSQKRYTLQYGSRRRDASASKKFTSSKMNYAAEQWCNESMHGNGLSGSPFNNIYFNGTGCVDIPPEFAFAAIPL